VIVGGALTITRDTPKAPALRKLPKAAKDRRSHPQLRHHQHLLPLRQRRLTRASPPLRSQRESRSRRGRGKVAEPPPDSATTNISFRCVSDLKPAPQPLPTFAPPGVCCAQEALS
jgi:hypothetical protein